MADAAFVGPIEVGSAGVDSSGKGQINFTATITYVRDDPRTTVQRGIGHPPSFPFGSSPRTIEKALIDAVIAEGADASSGPPFPFILSDKDVYITPIS